MAKASPEVTTLEERIRYHNQLYWDQAKPEISDYEYDQLVVRLKALAPESKVLNELGPSRLFGSEVRHKEPMLSLDKCYGEEDFEDWLDGFEGEVVAMPKFDGIACSIHYDETGALTMAATRGDGVAGDNITQNVLEIRDIPARMSSRRSLEVRGEIYMRLSVFAAFKTEGMANPRNLTAGAIKQKDRKKSAAYGLSFAAYDLVGDAEETHAQELAHLVELGFPKIDFLVLDRDKALEGYEQFAKLRPTLDYEIDGVVFKVNRLSEQRRLGQTAHHPRFALAYKFQGDTGVSLLRQIEWSVARTGAITPVAIVDPVVLSGVTVTRASLHNVAFIDRLELSLGAKVTLVRRGGVIPNVEFVVEKGETPVDVPSSCPSCGNSTVRERDFLFCSGPRSCKGAILGQLAHYAAVTDMKGFGEVVLEGAYDAGLLRDPAGFYTLETDALAKLQRMGDKLSKRLKAEVEKKRTLGLSTFLRALGIADVGKHVSQLLADRYRTLDAVLGVSHAELAATHGIGEIIAEHVVNGLKEAAPLIGRLRDHVKIAEQSASTTDGPLSGKSFVFTGKLLALARSEGEKRVQKAGGAVQSSVTKTLNYLVVGADKTGGLSTKQKAADKLIAYGAPIQILSEDEFLAMLAAPPATGLSRKDVTGLSPPSKQLNR